MKKHIIEYLSVLVILPTLCGCTDFLSTRSDSTMVRETFYKTESDLEMALTGSYSNLTSGHNMGTYAKGIQILGEVGTDEAFTSGDREVNALPLDIYSTLNSSNTIIGKFWMNAYAAINRNNEILAAAPNIEDATERLDGIVGETEFLQALWYFNLVRNFGGVPLKTKPSVSSDEFVKVPRDPVSTIYKYIIGLLEDAVEKLPETEYGSQVGRSDKYAAMGLLAKVYLHAASSMQLLQPTLTEDMKLDGINSFEWTDENDDGTPLTVEETIRYYYTKAAEYAKATIDYYGGEQCLELGNLVGEFYPVESTRDVLFEAVFSQGMSPNQGSEFCYLFGPGGGVNEGGGWNIIAPINCVVIPNYTCRYDAATKTWSSNDRRFLWSLSTYKYTDATGPAVILSGANPGSICKQIRINKFHSDRSNLPPHSLGTGVNNPILRLSDVCLIAAEALGELSYMESGTISEEALDYLNIVRRNAGVPEYGLDEVRHAEPIVLHQAFNKLVLANREIKGYTTTTDIEHWRRTLLNERMMELLGEGHRWYDLVRMGLLKPVVDGVTAFAGHGDPKVYLSRKIENFHVFRPIPLREMQVQQGYLVQNYGYY